TGHDENITVGRMREILGEETTYTLESMTRAVYTLGETIARDHGIIIADTKFEFGRDRDERIILIDEVMTPDSSRFWAADVYKPGGPQPSFDKQPLRDYLDAERKAGRWNGDAPAPPLPAAVVEATSKRYLEAYRRVTRCDLDLTIAGGKSGLPGPFALGHETAGRVVDVGSAVKNFVPGDLVIVPFQISCGECASCRRGHTNTCTSVPFRSSYGLKPVCGVE